MVGSSFRKPIKVWRYTEPAVLGKDGRFTIAEPTEITIKASVQPLKATEMEALPEGRRGSRAVKVYSDTELLMVDQQSGQQPDQFEWLGRRYEVVGSDAFRSGVINHYRAYAVEVTKT
jgi:hypothetical protein